MKTQAAATALFVLVILATSASAQDGFLLRDGCDSEINLAEECLSVNGTAGIRCCDFDGETCESYCKDGTACTTASTCGGSSADGRRFATFEEAVTLCNSKGKRLCTRDEMDARKCCGTGCNLHQYYVWTNPCDGSIHCTP